MEKKTLIMAAVGVWVGAGIIFVVWFLGGDSPPAGGENAPATSQTTTAAAPPAAAPNAAPAVSPTDSTAIAAASLPKTSSQTPPLDGGKVAIEVPEGWKVLARNSSFVVRMSPPNLALPVINVRTAEGYPGIEDLSPENAPQIAAKIHQYLQKEDKALTAPVTPVRIERRAGGATQVLRFARKAKQGGVVIEVLTVLYAQGGLSYEIELQTHADSLDQYANNVYAVAASIEPAAASDFGESFAVPETEAP